MSETIRIDARGLKCPWPAIRLGRALRGARGPVEILADDPAAEREIRALAQAAGLSVETIPAQGGPAFRIG